MQDSHIQQRAMPGPHDIARVVLDNGLTILVRENHAAPVAVLEGALPVGSIHAPARKGGSRRVRLQHGDARQRGL